MTFSTFFALTRQPGWEQATLIVMSAVSESPVVSPACDQHQRHTCLYSVVCRRPQNNIETVCLHRHLENTAGVLWGTSRGGREGEGGGGGCERRAHRLRPTDTAAIKYYAFSPAPSCCPQVLQGTWNCSCILNPQISAFRLRNCALCKCIIQSETSLSHRSINIRLFPLSPRDQ